MKQNEDIFLQIPHFSLDQKDFVFVASSGSKSAVGEHKVYKLPKTAIQINANAVNTYLGAKNQDKWLLALSEKHIAGVACLARAELAGAEIIKFENEKWNAGLFYSALLENQIAFTSIVPAQLFDLISEGFKTPPKLKSILVGAGHLSKTLLEKALALGWPILRTYSMTETASTVAIARDTQHYFDVLPCHQLRSNPDQILEVKSPCLYSGYWHITTNNPPQFVEPKLRGGWWKSLDRGECHDSKHMTFLGRVDSIIKINGFLVDKSKVFERFYELRDSLAGTNSIELCFRPDQRAGHLPVIFYETEGVEPLAVNELIEALNTTLPSYAQVLEHHALSKIPRSALGKFLEAEALTSLSGH